jgi:porin
MSGSHGVNPRTKRLASRSSLLAAGAIVALASGAFAQVAPPPPVQGQGATPDTSAGTFASQKVSNVPGADFGAPAIPQPEALVPQVNDYLHQYGTALLLSNVNEFLGVISGPRKGSTNAGQYGLEWDQDWNTLAGIPGLQTHSVAVGRYGSLAGNIFGDNGLNQSQEIYGAGGNVAIHLVFFYAEETVAHGHVAVAAGRMPMENDFDSNPLNCNFMQNSLCGNAKGITDNAANVSYPDAQWATRVRVRPISNLYIQTGIYFTENNTYQAGNGYRSGFHIDASHIDGEAFPIEAGYEPLIGPDKMPGHYKIGAMYENTNHNTWEFPGAPVQTRKGGTELWVQFDQMLVRNGPGATDGITVIGDYNRNDPRYSVRGNQYVIAGIDRNFWHARPFDTIGLLFAYQQISSNLTKLQTEEQELGIPITAGDGFANFPGAAGPQTHAINLEANYQIHVFRGVTFAPDFQYFIRPNAEAKLPSAALLGFKSVIELF